MSSRRPELAGPVNATAPIPVTNRNSPRNWAAGCTGPRSSASPAALLRRVGGDFANELLLGGQRVLPNKALSNGFVFRHETLRSAFEAIL